METLREPAGDQYEDENPITMVGSCHSIRTWASADPLKIGERPIGFMADLSVKPRYNVRVKGVRV